MASGPHAEPGRYDEALSRWREQLAAGKPWSEIEVEILAVCQSRVDLLTQLLIVAEETRPPERSRPRRARASCEHQSLARCATSQSPASSPSQVADELATSEAQIMALPKHGEPIGVQIGGRGHRRVEHVKLDETLPGATRRATAGRRQTRSAADERAGRAPRDRRLPCV